jgi:hypothetical protein
MPIGRIRLHLTRCQSGKCLCGIPRENTYKQRDDWLFSPDRNAIETRSKFRHKSMTDRMRPISSLTAEQLNTDSLHALRILFSLPAVFYSA